MQEDIFNIFSVAGGYLLDFGPFAFLAPGIGVRGSVGFINEDLGSFYGTTTPVGVMMFVRLRPARVTIEHVEDSGAEHH